MMCPACEKRRIGINGIVCHVCLAAASARYQTAGLTISAEQIREVIPLVRWGVLDPDVASRWYEDVRS